MKRSILIFLVLTMLVSLCACGSTAPQTTPAPASTPESTPEPANSAKEMDAPEETAEEPEAAGEAQEASGTSILVLYFSRTGEQYNVGVIEKGNTAIVAEMIGEATGADLYEILPAERSLPTHTAQTASSATAATAAETERMVTARRLSSAAPPLSPQATARAAS